MIAILNTVEYNEYKQGKREEAIIASLRPFLTKLSSAIVIMITSLTYISFGITSITNQISSLENAAASGAISDAEKLSSIETLLSTVDHSQTAGLLWVMVLLSAVLMIISYFLYQKHYTLDEAEYDRICKELAERRAA
jgi:melibiose permease/lactose/raffinose/galactose permease